jgi:toxin YoeB
VARQLLFHSDAWNDYIYWQTQDTRTLDRINRLIRESQRDPFRGLGKPEPLKQRLSGCWSRRIDETNRLVYRVAADRIEVVACRYHYGAR